MSGAKKYRNGSISIVVREFGYRTDIPLKEAVFEALTDDCRKEGFKQYVEDVDVIVEEVID